MHDCTQWLISAQKMEVYTTDWKGSCNLNFRLHYGCHLCYISMLCIKISSQEILIVSSRIGQISYWGLLSRPELECFVPKSICGCLSICSAGGHPKAPMKPCWAFLQLQIHSSYSTDLLVWQLLLSSCCSAWSREFKPTWPPSLQLLGNCTARSKILRQVPDPGCHFWLQLVIYIKSPFSPMWTSMYGRSSPQHLQTVETSPAIFDLHVSLGLFCFHAQLPTCAFFMLSERKTACRYSSACSTFRLPMRFRSCLGPKIAGWRSQMATWLCESTNQGPQPVSSRHLPPCFRQLKHWNLTSYAQISWLCVVSREPLEVGLFIPRRNFRFPAGRLLEYRASHFSLRKFLQQEKLFVFELLFAECQPAEPHLDIFTELEWFIWLVILRDRPSEVMIEFKYDSHVGQRCGP